MKKLNLDQMEMIEGGITCDDANDVLLYLFYHNHAQLMSIVNSGNSVMCYNSSGSYVSFWSTVEQ
jgi:hypothetical protein